MIGIDTIDRYTMKARVFPAVIAWAPALALAIVCIAWDSFSLTDAFTAIASLALLVALADIARKHGKKVEMKLLKKWGGLPSLHMLRHRDTTIDNVTKRRYLKFIAEKLGEDAPSEQEEEDNPDACDLFYGRCCDWLRERTRDKERFSILFEENTNYGFRRNLLGLKTAALSISSLVVLICICSLSFGVPINPSVELALKLAVIVGFSGIHAAFFLTYVNEAAVHEASRLYARQLILSCETLST
tara:strand:- start:467 stop:1198 length:732 start_codon:yes stop_codon:yes gene_type:complete